MKITRLTIREYAESLAVAFILAMIIRHYVVEAFRIPTSSMEPTLIGSESHGDRILVNKFEFDLHPPEQWDIIVFKIDQHRINYYRSSTRPPEAVQNRNGTVRQPGSADYVNYVKRLVGLPGKEIEVKNGDLFIDGEISRKPEDVEDVLLVPVTNDKILNGAGLSSHWAALGDESAISAKDGVLSLRGAQAGAECGVFYREPIEDRIPTDQKSTLRRQDSGGFNIVGDLKLALRVKHTGGSGHLICRLQENGQRYVFYLPLGMANEPARLLCGGREVARSAEPFEAAGEHRVEVSNIDARGILKVDGKTLIHFENNSPEESSARSVPYLGIQTSGAEFAANGCDATVRDIRLWRDIYYTSDTDQQTFAVGKPFTLGENEYFVMGDNSPNSYDSRNWGVVKRAHLIGEAFFVFWPVSRWKFIN